MEIRKKALKRILGWVLAVGLTAANCTPWAQSVRALPDTITVVRGEAVTYSFPFPLTVSYDGAAAAGSDGSQTLRDVGATGMTLRGEGTVTLWLLGMIPVKTIRVESVEQRLLVPGGCTLGLTLRTDGVLVVGFSPVTGQDGGSVSPATQAGVRAGDVITAVNGQQVFTSAELTALVAASHRAGRSVVLTLERAGEGMDVFVTPATDASGAARLGAWVRDSTAGVGTLTFYDPDGGVFGALGHPITDTDTGVVLGVRDGSVYSAEVVGAVVGQKGNPGELKGSFSSAGPIGDIAGNTLHGVFGTLRSQPGSLYPKGLPIATRSQVHTGDAAIISTVDGDGPREYSCRIIQLFQQDSPSAKSMVVEITDPSLIERTGGIVQGMSGSPIIQDGRIVGAVTHVYVSDPTKGYGVYIEWMLDAAEGAADDAA